MKKIWLLFFILFNPLAVNADQFDSRLGDLYLRLKSTDDAVEAAEVEASIWQIWLANDNPEFSGLMARGIQEMNNNSLEAALQTFSRLVSIAPDYAEAWNKRATIHYLLGNYRQSEEDIVRTLMLEPYHFGALSGRGLVYLAQGDYFQARRAFYATLEVHPHLAGVQYNLEALENYLRENAI